MIWMKSTSISSVSLYQNCKVVVISAKDNVFSRLYKETRVTGVHLAEAEEFFLSGYLS